VWGLKAMGLRLKFESAMLIQNVERFTGVKSESLASASNT
jgi:hypothetical protein